jgi:peptidoglycan pentaglycine glycine transferase (the first glycine)
MYKSELVTNREGWNRFVLSTKDNDLRQGYEWGEFRRYIGFTPYRVVVRSDDQLGALANILVAKSPLGTLMYAPNGPVVADPAALAPLMETVHELARANGAILFRSSVPNSSHPLLIDSGFRPLRDEWPSWNTGRVDVLLDIRGKLDDLRRRFRQKTRQYLERSLKKGVTYETSLAPARLHPLLFKNALRQGFGILPLGHYQALCDAYAPSGAIDIHFATCDGKDLAGLLTINHGRTVYLWNIGVDLEEYDNWKVGYGIYWHAITLAHQRGFTSLNWGTLGRDQPPHEGDKGYSLYWFRAGFGCQLRMSRRYCDLVFKPLRYRCFRATETSVGPTLSKFYMALRHRMVPRHGPRTTTSSVSGRSTPIAV